MDDSPSARPLPVVAVVGRPNVGKSSLVNRILGRREAIVEATPGVTRDRRGFQAEWAGRRFEILDTGGLEPGQEGLEARAAEQAQVAIEAADLVVLVVDARAGVDQDDLAVADILRRSGRPVVVAANKVDEPADEPESAAFFRFGLGRPHPLSALHGRGSGDFLDALVAALPSVQGEAPSEWGSFAIVGRPNVGKSSLLNALVGERRSIVDAAPGTTRDPVDSSILLEGGTRLRVVDTAGMRRQVQIKDPLEYFAWLRARGTLERVDAALLVADVAEGVTGNDQRIAEEIVSEGRACVVVYNKWDLAPDDPDERRRLVATAQERLRFLQWAPVVRTSAVTGRGVARLVPALETAIESHRRRLPTPLVNRIVRDAQARRPHPRSSGHRINILYAVQADVSPPEIVLFATGPVEPSYLRYLENSLRAVEPFQGSPLRLKVKLRSREGIAV